MLLSELGERGLLGRIRRRGLARREGVVRGIGDDAAAFRIGRGRLAVVSTDLLVEGVHFRLGRDSRRLGAKALLVNLSDLAAMGARPREAFLGIAAPGTLPVRAIDRFLDGFAAVGREHRINLLGGDLSASPRGLFVAVTVIGDAREGTLVFRSGARASDVLYVTGTLGDSAAGLAALERGLVRQDAATRRLVRAHELPRVYLAEGRWLAARGAVAMMDLSDGILADLPRLLEESGGLGATLDAEVLPLSPDLTRFCRRHRLDPLALALGGGEDYRLLVAVRSERAAALASAYRRRFGEPLSRIGWVERQPGIRLRRGGSVRRLAAGGFAHWRK